MRTRTERRTRMVSRTVGDKTHPVSQEYEVQVPVVPTDWDAVALSTVRAATTLSVLGAMAWSTVSIGDLLSMVAPSWVAYTVAGVFDLAWIVCMILEWLCRYDPARARIPRRAGWSALGISMVLIAGHGYAYGVLNGHGRSFLAVGIGGALVSAIAKSMWSVVMNHTAVKLSAEHEEWLAAERAETGTELALTAERRRLARTRDSIEAERRALGQDTTPEPDVQDIRPEPDGTLSASLDTDKEKAVRALAKAMDIPVELFGLDRTAGQDTDSRTGRPDRTAGQDTDSRPPGQDTQCLVLCPVPPVRSAGHGRDSGQDSGPARIPGRFGRQHRQGDHPHTSEDQEHREEGWREPWLSTTAGRLRRTTRQACSVRRTGPR